MLNITAFEIILFLCSRVQRRINFLLYSSDSRFVNKITIQEINYLLLCSSTRVQRRIIFFTIEFPIVVIVFLLDITAFESFLFCVLTYHSCCSLLVNFIFCIFFILIIFYYYYINPISSNYRKCHYRKCQ